MENLEIPTTQNVEIQYTIANLGDRIVSQIIDLVILFGYTLIAILIYTATADISSGSGLFFPVAFAVILFAPAFFYDFICEVFLNGQSFGKKIMKIKVVKLNGSQPTLINYFLRWILKPIEVYFAYGSVALITILINGKGQRIGDLAGNTTVIKLKQYVKLDEIIIQKPAVEREIVFPSVRNLNDEDVRLVLEIFSFGKNAEPDVFNEVLEKMRIRLEEKLGVKSELSAQQFLYTILKDYDQANIN